jgi:predicted metal-binding protein
MALAGGADVAKVVPAKNVVTAEWVRWKCQFGCSGYNKRLCCPPRTPTPDETRRMLTGYRRALIYSYRCEPATYVRFRPRMHRLAVSIERTMFLDGYYKAFALVAGPCRFCKTCNVDGLCRHPDLVRPAMEACGIDVYATARGAGIELNVVTREGQSFKNVNLVLID